MTRHQSRWAQGRATSRGVPTESAKRFDNLPNRKLARFTGGDGLFLQPSGRGTRRRG